MNKRIHYNLLSVIAFTFSCFSNFQLTISIIITLVIAFLVIRYSGDDEMDMEEIAHEIETNNEIEDIEDEISFMVMSMMIFISVLTSIYNLIVLI